MERVAAEAPVDLRVRGPIGGSLRAEVDQVERHRIAKAIVRLHIDMNSAAVQSQRNINVAALTETASVMFAIDAMLAHPRDQLKMLRLAAYDVGSLTVGRGAVGAVSDNSCR